MFLQLDDHPAGLGVDFLRQELLVDGAHRGGDAGLRPLGHPGQQVGHEVGVAGLPTGGLRLNVSKGIRLRATKTRRGAVLNRNQSVLRTVGKVATVAHPTSGTHH